LALATVVVGLLAVGPVGCGGGNDEEECAAGTRGCECAGDGTCEAGLMCVDEVCRPSTTDAGSTDGASDAGPDMSSDDMSEDGTSDSSSDGGDGVTDSSDGGSQSKSAKIGPSGGELSVGESRLSVPEGALQTEKEISITQTTQPAPAGYDAYSSVYAFEPSGLQFEKPVEVSVAVEGDAQNAAMFWSRPANKSGFERLGGTVDGGSVTAQVDHFSTGFVADGVNYPDAIVPTKVSAGSGHTCVVLKAGGVRCWGAGGNGELGNGSKSKWSTTPVAVKGISTATDVAVGGGHVCALVKGGEVRCWGHGEEGELGNGKKGKPQDGKKYEETLPVAVQGMTTATDIAASGHTCAVVDRGKVRCWGEGWHGKLGDGEGAEHHNQSVPVRAKGFGGATAVAAGGQHTCAVLKSGEVLCWGNGEDGQLGQGSEESSWTPVFVKGISKATDVAAGGDWSCAVLESGAVRCWGNSAEGRLGDGSSRYEAVTTPVGVKGLSTANNISAGHNHTCVVLDSGEARCWGWGTDGRLGNGDPQSIKLAPVAVNGISTAAQIAAGGDHTCALLQSSQVKCWGAGGRGQLGHGIAPPRAEADSLTPVTVNF
jgi:alpha-tubulin suppressor-like RCC1 family protein